MKQISIVLLLTLFSISHAFAQQPIPPVPILDGKVNYNEVITVEGVKKDILYGRAKLWIANTVKSSNNIIQTDEKDNEVVIGRGSLDEEDLWNSYTWTFTIKIQLKDEKYKAEFYDIQKKSVTKMKKMADDYGISPETFQDLNSIFNDPKMYKKDGSVKDGFKNLANETDKVIKPLLSGLRKAMTGSTSDF